MYTYLGQGMGIDSVSTSHTAVCTQYTAVGPRFFQKKLFVLKPKNPM